MVCVSAVYGWRRRLLDDFSKFLPIRLITDFAHNFLFAILDPGNH